MKKSKINLIFLVLNLLLFVLGYFFVVNGTFSSLDDWINKKFYKVLVYNPSVPGADKVALIKIDEKFFDKSGVTTWTFHRGYYADVLEKLKKWGAKNVVFDVFFGPLKLSTGGKVQKYFNATIKYFNQQLISALSGNVVLGVIPSATGLALPSKNYLNKGVFLGYVESYQNKNGINVGVVPYYKDKSLQVFTLGIAAYLDRLYVNGVIGRKIDAQIIPGKYIFSKKFKITPDILKITTTNPKISLSFPLSEDIKGQRFLFTKLFLVYPKYTYSFYDILANKIDYPESIFDGKTVFIGATDQTLNDIKLSYLGMIPGVSFHINTFLQAYNKNYAYLMPLGLVMIILLVLFLFGYFFVLIGKDQIKSLIAFLALSFSAFVIYVMLFSGKGIIFPLGTILVLFFLKLLLDLLHILILTGINKEKFKQWFSTYVGKTVLDKKEKLGDIKIAEKKPIALMFTDIASFTDISEKLAPTQVVTMLNVYFEKANFLLNKSNVYIDKYIGDAIMAFWENNINFDLILTEVLKFQKIHPYLNKVISGRISQNIQLNTRIGLHYGEAVVGDIGDKSKMNYTAIGDNVNLASRLEGINKYYGTNVILSENFYDKIKKKSDFAIRLLDKITVKGKKKPVKIYQLMLYDKGEITDELLKYIFDFESGLKYYFEGNFKASKIIFEELLSTFYGQKDKVLKIFLERISFLLQNPPENWDGVWKFTTK